MELNVNGVSCHISQWELSKLLASEKAMIDGKSKAGFLDAVRQSGTAKKIISDKSGYQEELKPLLIDYVKRGAFVVKKGQLKLVKNQLLAARTNRQQERSEINSMRSSWQAIRGSVVEIDKRLESRQATCARLSNQLKSLDNAISELQSQKITVPKNVIEQRDAIQKKLDEQTASIENIRKNCRFFQENIDASMALKNQELPKFKQENDTINKGFNWIKERGKKLGVEEDHSIITDLDNKVQNLQDTLNDFKNRAEFKAVIEGAARECTAYGHCIEEYQTKVRDACKGRKLLLQHINEELSNANTNGVHSKIIEKIAGHLQDIDMCYKQFQETFADYDNLKNKLGKGKNALSGNIKDMPSRRKDIEEAFSKFSTLISSINPSSKGPISEGQLDEKTGYFKAKASQGKAFIEGMEKKISLIPEALNGITKAIIASIDESNGLRTIEVIADFIQRGKESGVYRFDIWPLEEE